MRLVCIEIVTSSVSIFDYPTDECPQSREYCFYGVIKRPVVNLKDQNIRQDHNKNEIVKS